MSNEGKMVFITQTPTILKERLFDVKIYRKICEQCNTGVRARSKGKRVCPRCGGHLRKASDAEKATDTFLG